MQRKQKIERFLALLLLAHSAHLGEHLWKRQEGPASFLTWIFWGLSLAVLVALFLYFLRYYRKQENLLQLRYFCIFYLSYGLLLALLNIYREGAVPGVFTGFLLVMIALPLLLTIQDELKEESTDS